MLLTRSPLVYPRKGLTVRLACVKHAASVRPEPGSNSPLKFIGAGRGLFNRQSNFGLKLTGSIAGSINIHSKESVRDLSLINI